MRFDDKKEIFKTKYNLIVDILTSVASLYIPSGWRPEGQLYQDPTNFIVLTFVNHCKARYEPFLYLYKKKVVCGFFNLAFNPIQQSCNRQGIGIHA